MGGGNEVDNPPFNPFTDEPFIAEAPRKSAKEAFAPLISLDSGMDSFKDAMESFKEGSDTSSSSSASSSSSSSSSSSEVGIRPSERSLLDDNIDAIGTPAVSPFTSTDLHEKVAPVKEEIASTNPFATVDSPEKPPAVKETISTNPFAPIDLPEKLPSVEEITTTNPFAPVDLPEKVSSLSVSNASKEDGVKEDIPTPPLSVAQPISFVARVPDPDPIEDNPPPPKPSVVPPHIHETSPFVALVDDPPFNEPLPKIRLEPKTAPKTLPTALPTSPVVSQISSNLAAADKFSTDDFDSLMEVEASPPPPSTLPTLPPPPIVKEPLVIPAAAPLVEPSVSSSALGAPPPSSFKGVDVVLEGSESVKLRGLKPLNTPKGRRGGGNDFSFATTPFSGPMTPRSAFTEAKRAVAANPALSAALADEDEDPSDEDPSMTDAEETSNMITLRGLINVYGRDQKGRPIVVIDASCIPGPKLRFAALEKIKDKMDPIVQAGEYTLVFVMSPKVIAKDLPPKPVPAWWCLKVYRNKLPREYKKNVKKIVFIHPTFFISAVFTLLRPFLSAKAVNKIVRINHLSELEEATGGDVTLEAVRLPQHSFTYDHEQAALRTPPMSPRNATPAAGGQNDFSQITI